VNSSKWIFITAGLGSPDFEDAAERVISQSKSLYEWEQQIALTEKNIADYCPTSVLKYSAVLNSQTVGYGFMVWKAEIVFRSLNGEFGPCDGVVWVDAGCEVVSNTLSKFRLRRHLHLAKKFGAEVFSLETPEVRYTKKDLFHEFPKVDQNDTTPQIQTTNFYLFGEQGLDLARKWFDVATTSQSFIDESPSIRGEVKDFITHRHDQSIFSLCCKSTQNFHKFHSLTTGTGTRKALIKGFFSPFWASRNRTGTTKVPSWFNFSILSRQRSRGLQ
jgi:hypothetical protein